MKIGFIGLGIMGEAMAKNIVTKHEDSVYVYDKNEARVKIIENAGGKACRNSKEVVEKSDLIITMVPTSQHSEELYLEVEESLIPGQIAIDMSTIDPEVSVRIWKRLKEKGVQFFDAPVVKSRPAAEKGELGIYVGGDKEAYQKIIPILSYMGKNIIYLGENGAGLIMKICHNTLVAQIQNGVNETLVLARKNNIPVDEFVKAISYGGGQNFYLDSKAGVIEKEDFTTAFSVQNMRKDLSILKRLADKSLINLPGADVCINVYDRAVEYGLEAEDFSATYKVVRKDNSL